MKSIVKFLILLFVSLSVIFSCEKDDYKPKVNPLDTIPQLSFTTKLDTIYFIIYADKIDQPNVWIDLNGNGKRDSNETVTKFEKYLDLNKDVFYTCVKSVKTVTVYGKITHFSMPTQELTHIDVSKSKWLIFLDLFVNEIEEVDLSQNVNLETLHCPMSEIHRLDVSNCPKLVYLNCSDNYIENLDISKSTKLEELRCYGNKLRSLDVSNNIKLKELYSNDNLLRDLDVTQNRELKSLGCSGNQLTYLDVSNCPKLEKFGCMRNEQLKCIKVNEKQSNNIPKNWHKPASAIYTTTDCE